MNKKKTIKIFILFLVVMITYICSPLSAYIALEYNFAKALINIFKVVAFFIAIIYMLKNKIDKSQLLLVLFLFIFLYSTLRCNYNIVSAINYFITVVGFYVLLSFLIKEYAALFVRWYIQYITLMLWLNLLSIIVFTNGIGTAPVSGYIVRLIGIDNSLASIFYPYIIIMAFELERANIKFCYFIFNTIGVIATELFVFSATSLIGLVPLIIMLFLTFIRRRGRRLDLRIKIDLGFIFCIYSIGFLFINYFSQDGIFNIISHLFNKSLSFSGRIFIWEKCREIVNRLPLFGYGQYDLKLIETPYFMPANTHSFLYEVVLMTGIVGLIIFVALIFKCYKKLKKNDKKGLIYSWALCYLIMILVMGLAESTALYLGNYIILALSYYSEYYLK